ncbi:MAG: potassium-transporting ATPase subunit F [Pseudanabaena sp. ELA607]
MTLHHVPSNSVSSPKSQAAKTPSADITAVFMELADIFRQVRKQKLPLYLFLALCSNLLFAPMVYAASGNELSRFQAWALGVLGLVTVSLSIYLFVVMFAPEKF